MARAKLEYDDSGSTFFYFLISFYLLILLPVTYFLWPRRKQESRGDGLECHCEPCRSKKARLDREKPSETYKTLGKVLLLTVLWSLLIFMVYKVFTVETDYEEYDPFEILQIDSSATTSEIKKQYRKLSKIFHPDKQGGDQDMFMKIAKAYEALTDEVSKENWQKYGNPDGPQAATFGIALPAWIVEKNNSILVLVVYMSVFAIVLPIIVGVWWYRSIKYGSTNVLLQTSQIYLYFMARAKSITPKRVVMILTAAFEFNPEQCPLVKKRPSDDLELSEIIRSKALPHIDIKTKENPFCAPYAAKARILVHAHLERMLLRPDTLQIDQLAVLKTCPQLIQEMISALVQYWVYCKQRQTPPPCVEVFECVMNVSQMIIQGMWSRGTSPILQLPHVTLDQLKHFKTRRRQISTISQFVAMKEDERRLLVRALTDVEYLNVMAVCSMFPHVQMSTDMHVVDDFASKKVTAGSLVTVAVNMTRTGLLRYHNVNIDKMLCDTNSLLPLKENGSGKFVETLDSLSEPLLEARPDDDDHMDQGQMGQTNSTDGGNTKSWEKAKKKKKGKVPASKKRTANPKKNKKNNSSSSTLAVVEDISEDEEDVRGGESEGREDGEGGEGGEDGVRDEEEEWNRLQKNIKKQKALQQTKKESHPVHAPLFPPEKQECWWLFIVDRKKRELICPPQRITGLKDTFSTDLQFAAPNKPGTMRYTVVLTSDSYIDLSFQQELKLVVHEREEVKGTDQWKDLEEEEQEEELIEETDSEGISSYEEDEDDED